MGIGEAVAYMRNGIRVTRKSWNGKGMYIGLREPGAGSEMTEPYVFMKTVSGSFIPWTCSQADLLGDDWEVAGRG